MEVMVDFWLGIEGDGAWEESKLEEEGWME